MGKLDCFTIPGLDCWFNSHDHLPAHFHASKTAEWEVRVFFLTCTDKHLVYELKWGTEPSKKHRTALLEAVLGHRAQLLVEWETKTCR